MKALPSVSVYAMGITGTIEAAFNFKKSALGVADIGRENFSQAVELITFCRKITIDDRLDLWAKLKE